MTLHVYIFTYKYHHTHRVHRVPCNFVLEKLRKNYIWGTRCGKHWSVSVTHIFGKSLFFFPYRYIVLLGFFINKLCCCFLLRFLVYFGIIFSVYTQNWDLYIWKMSIRITPLSLLKYERVACYLTPNLLSVYIVYWR